MKATVTDQIGMADPELLQTAERRMFFTLARFEGDLTRANLVIREAENARQGLHLCCELSVHSRRAGDIQVRSQGADLGSLVCDVIDRMGRTLTRRLDQSVRGASLPSHGVQRMGER